MALIVNARRALFQRFCTSFQKRLVSTSKKNNDTVAAEISSRPARAETKNWVSYGFDYNSKEVDRNAMHSLLFAGISILLVTGGFYIAYMPDYNLRDWSTREAFLELRRREEAGLPLVDPNLIPPEKIVLPTDEELGDTEIII
ncbi:NADH dehydrogenase [ubiquinone] 1 beta subcomplex subunit NP15.6 [Rhynchophorus ferrugineus]|uniref:NADH dehydrogenase [ubiquinone] 1 beta subcomplex subunit NP15.6 n=1 Tax=Rhynchophorus ferrugineus TaxID=354439 RepID=UPI003FCE2F18